MARTNTLGNFLTDVADAIRTAEGSSGTIQASDFDTRIEALSGGGGADLSEYFNNTITENTSKSTYFELIKKLPVINVDNNVTSLSYLFLHYTVNRKGQQTTLPKVVCGDNVTDMSYMYYGGSSDTSLTTVDLSGLDTSNVTTIANMFAGRKALTEVDFRNFTGASIPQGGSPLTATFIDCINLRKVDLSNFAPTQGSLSCVNAFANCFKLEEIYLDKWDIHTINNSGNIFYNCGANLTDGAVTKVYVKDQAAQNWILSLSSSSRPSSWSTDNVIIAGSEADLRNA